MNGIRKVRLKYEEWWLNKRCRVNSLQTFKKVERVEVLGCPSGFYASVTLHYDDGTSDVVYHGNSYKPRKKDVEVEELHAEHREQEDNQS